MRSLYDAVYVAQSLVPDIRTASANGTGVDTKGYNSALVVVSTGAIDTSDEDETYTFKVQESSDNAVADAYADVSGATTTVTAAGVAVIRVDGLGTSRERYLRVVATLAGTTPSHEGEALILLGNAFSEPVR